MNQPIGFVDPRSPTTPGSLTVTATTQTSISVAVDCLDRRRRRHRLPSTPTALSPGRRPEPPSRSTASRAGRPTHSASKRSTPRATSRLAPLQSGSTSLCDAPPGLVAAYSFDEGSGSPLNDASGNGHNGTINGATWTTGRYGGALSFNGINASSTSAPRHLLPGRLHARGLGPEADLDQERRRDRRHLHRRAARCSGSTTSPPATT